MAKRTPSPRYLAAKLLEHFDEPAFFRTAAEMTEAFGTKVSEAKRDKILKAVETLTAGLHARLKKIRDRFDSPPPRRPPREKT